MFTVKLDQSRDALTISYGGRVTPDEIGLCAEEVRLMSFSAIVTHGPDVPRSCDRRYLHKCGIPKNKRAKQAIQIGHSV